jgi:hypothetical protein
MPLMAISVLPETTESSEKDAEHCYANISHKFETSFSDRNIQFHYEQFRVKCVTSDIVIMWLCVVAFVSVNSIGALYILATKYDSTLYIVQLVQVGRIALCLLAAFVCIKIVMGVSSAASKQEQHRYTFLITKLTNIIIIGFPVVNGLMLCWRASKGPCEDSDQISHTFHCNESYESGGVPTSDAIFLLMFTTFNITTLRCHNYWAVQICYAVTIVSAAVSVYLTPEPMKSLILLLSSVMIVIIGRGLEINTFTLFSTLLNLETSQRNQTRELKQFIGNVAHDLKVLRSKILLSD